MYHAMLYNNIARRTYFYLKSCLKNSMEFLILFFYNVGKLNKYY